MAMARYTACCNNQQRKKRMRQPGPILPCTVRFVQVHSLLNVVRPDRQTLLFSATLPRKIESLVAEALSNPVRISVGLLGAANADVSQRVEVMKGECDEVVG